MTSELLERYPGESGVAQNRMLVHMQHFLATNKDLQAAKQSIGPCISCFDPRLACQPQGIFCKVCMWPQSRFCVVLVLARLCAVRLLTPRSSSAILLVRCL